jgi:hypothetical protein
VRRVAELTSLGCEELMWGFVLNVAKGAGIATLYGATALLVCVTADACLWEPFLAHYGGDGSGAWPAFVNYYKSLVQIMTAVAAALAARSYRPGWGIGGLLTGTAAALVFRVAEWWGSCIPGRAPPSIWLAILAALLLGMVFGLLGTVSVRRTEAQPASPNGGPAEPFGSSGVTEGPPSVS